MMNPHIFRAYDVRGRVGEDLTPEVFRLIGRAYGTLIRQKAGRTIALGQDNRFASTELKAAFAEGARAAGVSIVDIGLAPTPVLYFATAHWKLDGGANVTGSHNPIEYNGVKMIHAGAMPLSEEEIQGLRATIEAGRFESGSGSITQRDPREEYFNVIQSRVKLERRLGCEVVELYCELDGRFPHHLPDPEMEANTRDLQVRVVAERADAGIAFDGDADRMGLVDEKGQRHEADLILILLARDLLSRHPGAKVLFDVKSSQLLIEDIRARGGIPVMYKTGHSLLKLKMRKERILLGGEVSGHMFFAEDYYGVDDGILAAAKVLEVLSRVPGPVSAQFDALPHLYATPELKAPCPDGEKFRVVAELVREFKAKYETIDIDGARIVFPGGWGLVRASNTNPYLTLRFEARTREELEQMKRIVFEALARYPFVTLPA